MLAAKYGIQFAEGCRNESDTRISQKLKHKLSIQAPPKLLIEKYLIEIAKSYDIPYEPDPQVMREESDGVLIDLSDKNNLGGIPQPVGFIGYPQLPYPSPFNYPVSKICILQHVKYEQYFFSYVKNTVMAS